MNKLKILLVLITLTLNSFSQDTLIRKDGTLSITIESGIGEKIQMQFAVSDSLINQIQRSDFYKSWESEMINDTLNRNFMLKHKNLSNIDKFLMSKISMAVWYTKFKLKNGDSYTPIPTSKGLIYITDKGILTISHKFKGQNGYGNMIFSTSVYTYTIKNKKPVSDCFIF